MISGFVTRWVSNRLGCLALGLGAATLGFAPSVVEASSEVALKATAPVPVVSWERSGLRWAIGRGAQGEALVLSDLSFPWLLDRTLLLKVGGKEGVLGSVSSFEGDSSRLEPLKEPLARAEKLILGNGTGLRWLEEEAGLPWNVRAGAGNSRSLADVDWERLVARSGSSELPRKFHQAWATLGRAFFGEEALLHLQREVLKSSRVRVSADLDQFSGELLRSAVYLEKSQEEGGLEVVFDPLRSLKEHWGVRGEIPSPAKRLVDFQCPTCGFWEMIGFDALDNAIDVAIGFIPVPGLSQVLGTAFDRLFHYREEAYRLQWAMLWEALDAVAMRPESPEGRVLAGLTAQERERAISILQYSDSTLTTVIRWLWMRPLKAWRASLERDQKRSDLAAHWLRQRGMGLESVTPNFAFGRSLLGEQWLYSLAAYRVFPSITEPSVVVDYQKPDDLKVRRIAMDSATAAVGFASRFAPWIGNLVRVGWTAAVEQPQRVLQHREARLAWVLETRDPALSQFGRELRIIEGQRMNPFVFRQPKMREQVEKRWKSLGVALSPVSGQGRERTD